jgi:hypothetical protein
MVNIRVGQTINEFGAPRKHIYPVMLCIGRPSVRMDSDLTRVIKQNDVTRLLGSLFVRLLVHFLLHSSPLPLFSPALAVAHDMLTAGH